MEKNSTVENIRWKNFFYNIESLVVENVDIQKLMKMFCDSTKLLLVVMNIFLLYCNIQRTFSELDSIKILKYLESKIEVNSY